MKNYEVEVRSLISEKDYVRLQEFFKKNGQLVKEDEQETVYFGGELDFRIQQNKFFSKLWLKEGKIHDDVRKEWEVRFGREDFSRLKEMLEVLGFKAEIKWLRKRQEYKWENINVCLDETAGYGNILELERMCETEDKEEELKFLQDKMTELKIKVTPREEFDKHYEDYKQNWRQLIGDSQVERR